MQKEFKKPCPMGRTYPTSVAELETWVEQTVQREIVRGRMLQDQKSLVSERLNNASGIVKPPRLAGENLNRRSSIPKWMGKRGRSNSPLSKNARMSTSASRDSREESCSSYSYKSPRLGRPACSMRISELAAPTKRQCIAAWRANAKVLPAPMVDRLKQRVMDQEPIVKVSDAVNCMKNKKIPSDTRNNVEITSAKRASRKINKEAMRSRIRAENKMLSDVFGMKIAQLLMQPVAITLNSQLQNLSNVISEEIKKVIKDTQMFKTDKATNMRMLQETSEKVTIWIAKILEESSEKLLEEELKARAIPAGELITLIQIITYKETDLEEQEGPVLDLLDDMVDNILHKCVKTPSEPLSPEYVSVSSGDVDKEDSVDMDQRTAEDDASQGDIITVDEEPNKDTIVDDIIKQLNKVLDSIEQDDISKSISKGASLDKNRQDETDFGHMSDITPEPNTDIIPEPEKEAESDNNLEPDNKPESDTSPEVLEVDIKTDSDINPKYDIKSEFDTKAEPDIDVLYSNHTSLVIPSEYDDEHNTNEGISHIPEMMQPSASEINEMPIMQSQDKGDDNFEDTIFIEPQETNLIDLNEEQNSNVSGAIELITGESSEEKSKKVQFSNENLDALSDKGQINPFIREILQFEDEHLLETVADFEKPNIDFAPPNEELLSDADESWPEKMPLTKPSASVTRSISSMGKLLESDEMNYTVIEDNIEHSQHKTSDSDSNREDSDEDLHNIDRDEIEDWKENKTCDPSDLSELKSHQDSHHLIEIEEKVLHGPLPEPETENVTTLLKLAQDASVASVREHESVILIRDEELQDSQHMEEPELTHSKWHKHDNTISMKDLDISKCIQSKMAKNEEEGSIIGQIDQGRSIGKDFTSQKFDYSADRMKQREIEMRKWCRDLDFILMNLDRWKNWLDYISKYITELKRKAGKISGSRQVRSPPGAGENTSWRALNKRAKGGLEMQRQEETVKFKIPPAPVKFCVNCGRTKPTQMRKRHHRSQLRNKNESLCKRHHKS